MYAKRPRVIHAFWNIIRVSHDLRVTTMRCDSPFRRIMCQSLAVGTLCFLQMCTSSTAPRDSTRCARAGEFGASGCADISVSIAPGSVAVPGKFALEMRVRPARPNSGADPSFLESPALGVNTLRLTLFRPLQPSGTDTLSVWVVAKLFDAAAGASATVPVGVDSSLVVLRFVPEGSVPAAHPTALSLKLP